MRVTSGQEDECQQSGESSIEDGNAHVYDGHLGPLLPGAGHGEEGVADVDAVVHTQPDGDDDITGAYYVDGDVPGRHEAAQVYKAESDCTEDVD